MSAMSNNFFGGLVAFVLGLVLTMFFMNVLAAIH